MFTFESENSGIGVHESRISSDWASQRLHWHVHINHNNTVLRSSFPDANVLIRFHRHVSERDELRVDSDASQLQKNDHRIAKSKIEIKK